MTVGRRSRRPLLGLAVAVSLVACATPARGDKAGADEPPVTLTLGSPDAAGLPGTAALEHFAAEVASRSGGRLTVRIIWNAAGDGSDVEGEVIRQVRNGTLDLGWVGTRAWDGQGITGFSALQTPFLITDYAVLDAVVRSDVVRGMLGELEEIGVKGLGVYPDQLRHPLGFREPFLTLDDFEGAVIRVPTSNVSDNLLESLGAVPAHLNGAALGHAIASGELAGAETSIGNATMFPIGSALTANISFYPKLFTLFAADGRFGSLSESARSTLIVSADDTLAFLLGQDPEGADIEVFCELGGTIAHAVPEEVARIAAAANPVRRALEADPAVADYIRQIEELRAAASPAAPVACPP